mgnify:CR=1 FL=1
MVVASLVLGINLWSMSYRAAWPSPLTPWESAYVIAGETLSRGGDIYNFPGDPKTGNNVEGPAAVMYGPALPLCLGVLVKTFGSWPYYARFLSLAAAAGIALLAIRLQPQRCGISVLFATALVAAVNWRSRSFFTDARPDMLAWLLAALALVSFYLAHARERWSWYFPGTVLLVIALLFKQTTSIYAVVPIAAVLFTNRRRSLLHLGIAVIPLTVIVLTASALKVLAPDVFHYFISMPSYWPIRWTRIWDASSNAITFDPLFALCMGVWIVRPELLKNPAMIWLVVTTGTAIAAGAVFFAKTGGSYNSYIPAWLPSATFSAAILTWLVIQNELPMNTYRVAVMILTPIAMLASAFGITRGSDFVVHYQNGYRNYAQIIQVARALPGIVVCPEDPTIAFEAKGELTRSFTVEIEAVQNRFIPALMQQEMYSADWLVWIGSPYTELISTADLWRLGFVLEDIEGIETGTYQIWRRDHSVSPQVLEQGVGQPPKKNPSKSTRKIRSRN